jgi:dihydrofolate reductase
MISIIAAVSSNGVYGSSSGLPWSFKTDMDFFKGMTSGSTIIMGRSTWESLGRSTPLPNRQNIVVSNKNPDLPQGVICASTPQQAIDMANQEKIFLIGGKNIWLEGIRELADTLFITEILSDFPAEEGFVFPGLTSPGHFTNRTFSKHTIGEETVEDTDKMTGKMHKLHFARYDLFKI